MGYGMFNLRNIDRKHRQQTLALCAVWGALMASAGLCALAPSVPMHGAAGGGDTNLGTLMISLASKGF